jgi:predicted GNAT superfamily acetyltransferase
LRYEGLAWATNLTEKRLTRRIERDTLAASGNNGNAICDLSLLDTTAVLLLNNTNAKETSALDDAGMKSLLDMAFYARGIDRGATALLIAFEHNAAYVNPNFMWFQESRESFVYIDRIIVSISARSQGIASSL